MIKDHMKNQFYIDFKLRAQFLNWVVNTTAIAGVEDAAIILRSIMLMDRYYSKVRDHTKLNLQLTGTTCLFMLSKMNDVRPMNKEYLYNVLCFKKYHRRDFDNREIDILSTVMWDIDTPTIIDFCLVYHFHMLSLC
jgi:hypothetical protein